MNLGIALVIGAFAALAFAVVLWGLFSNKRSPLLGLIAAAVALLASLAAWYAWAETRSMPWTVAYACVGFCAGVTVVRQFGPRRE